MRTATRTIAAIATGVLPLLIHQTVAYGGVPAAVWGLKSNAPTSGASGPPTSLFRFPFAGGPLVNIGALTVGGAQIDADALVELPSGSLQAFRITAAGSQLIAIPPTAGAATAVGPVLAGRDIRGAVALSEDELLAIDVAGPHLIRVDTRIGEVVGTPIPLTRGCVPTTVTTISGLALREDGLLVLVDLGEYLTLSPTTGRLQRLFVDSVGIPPSPTVAFTGIAFGRDAHGQILFSYEVIGPDDIVSYDLDDGLARTILYTNFIPAFNAGRGELATWIDASPIEPPPGPVGDLNGDGVVNGADLGILLNGWGPCRGCCIDLNGDGVIDGADLGILLDNWG